MGCDEIREILSADLDGAATPGEVRTATDHVAGCGPCARWSADARRIHRALAPVRRTATPTTPIVLPRPPPVHSTRRTAAALTAAAVAVLVLAGVVVASRQPAERPELRSVSGTAAAAGTAESTTAYLTIVNDGGEDRLVAASSPIADQVVLHDERLTGMAAEDAYRIESDGTTRQTPGGAHLMLEGLQRPLQPGDSVEVELRFDRGGPMTLTLQVVDPVD